MELGVYELNNGYIKLASMPAYNSLVWQECLKTSGQAQVVFTATLSNIERVRGGMFIGIPLSTTLMYIHSIKIENDKLWAYGAEAKWLLGKQAFRVSMNDGGGSYPHTVYTSAQILSKVNSCCQLPFYDSSQNSMSQNSAATASLDDAKTLYDLMNQYMAIEDCGFAMELKSNGKMALKQINGVDRSGTVRLATALGNVGAITVSESDQKYYNRVVVIGRDKEDSEYAYIQTVDRPFLAVDGIPMSHQLDVGADFPRPADMSQADYQSALISRGIAALNGGLKRKQEIKVNGLRGELYGNPLNLGDTVTVAVPELDISAQQRVTAVQFTAESNTVLTALTLG